MIGTESISSVAHVIQLAVAPVFLLTGIGALLNVLTNRLARIVDRVRQIEGRLVSQGEQEGAQNHEHFQEELDVQARRGWLVRHAISLCTLAALLVCVVIAALFTGTVVGTQMSGTAIALLFIAAMLALICGLLLFLREIYLAMVSIRLGPRR